MAAIMAKMPRTSNVLALFFKIGGALRNVTIAQYAYERRMRENATFEICKNNKSRKGEPVVKVNVLLTHIQGSSKMNTIRAVHTINAMIFFLMPTLSCIA